NLSFMIIPIIVAVVVFALIAVIGLILYKNQNGKRLMHCSFCLLLIFIIIYSLFHSGTKFMKCK
ncbi:hypothetical protein GOODEAATRI_026082, partial [Goodea atripinnis]